MSSILLLSLIVFLPALAAIALLFFPRESVEAIRLTTLAATAVVFVLTLILMAPGQFETVGDAARHMQGAFNRNWIPSFNINYYMGVDGISLPLIVLTSFISLLAMLASWSITKYVKAYCVLFLLLETGMLGVFMALDFFLFYVFWEVMLLPMYFLIGVWGGPRREYAAIKFFLYTLVGSVLMLIAILVLYFSSDLRELARAAIRGPAADRIVWSQLHLSEKSLADAGLTQSAGLLFMRGPAGADQPLNIQFERSPDAEQTVAIYDAPSATVSVLLADGQDTAADVAAAMQANLWTDGVVDSGLSDPQSGDRQITADDSLDLASFRPERTPHTFNLLALASIGQHTGCVSRTVQMWCFLLLFIGFVIKVPSVPVHTWLPDAHVEAPTPISMILAGVLLKMGGYGIIRICYPICPWGGYDLMYVVCGIGVVSMVYGAFAALAQKDFKRLVAYSSVSHMGYVVLGFGVWSVGADTLFNPDYWNMGIKGAMFQMIGHGVSSAGMFFMVGVVYDRVHHRNLDEFGGLFGKMPVYTALSIGIFFAALGLPGLCGFIGEVLVVLSVWKFSPVMAVISAFVVIITAGYILWTLQRVYLGAQYNGPHEEDLRPITGRELAVAIPLFVFAILLGVFPHHIPGVNLPSVLAYMDETVDHQVEQLTSWTRRETVVLPGSWPAAVPAEDRPAVAANVRDDRPEIPRVTQLVRPTTPVTRGRLSDP